MAFKKYLPNQIALFLLKKDVLSPMHYHILTTLQNVSVSYQSSVLLEMLKQDVEYLQNYRELIQLVITEKYLLRHIYSTWNDIG